VPAPDRKPRHGTSTWPVSVKVTSAISKAPKRVRNSAGGALFVTASPASAARRARSTKNEA
jgi:hypothetical protein